MDSRPGVFLHRMMGVCPGREGTGGAAAMGVQAGKGMDGPSRGPALLRASSVVCPGLWLLLNPADLGQAGSCSGGSGAIAGEGGSRSLPRWQRGQGTPRGGLHLTGDPLPDPGDGGMELLLPVLLTPLSLSAQLSVVWGAGTPLSGGLCTPKRVFGGAMGAQSQWGRGLSARDPCRAPCAVRVPVPVCKSRAA